MSAEIGKFTRSTPISGKPVVRKITQGAAGAGAVAESYETALRSNGTIDLRFQFRQDTAIVSLNEVSKAP